MKGDIFRNCGNCRYLGEYTYKFKHGRKIEEGYICILDNELTNKTKLCKLWKKRKENTANIR